MIRSPSGSGMRACHTPNPVVSNWYHLGTMYYLTTLLPEAAPLYAISWKPVYAGNLVTRTS